MGVCVWVCMCALWFPPTMHVEIYICLWGAQLICSSVCSWKKDLFVIFPDRVFTVTGILMCMCVSIDAKDNGGNVNCTCVHMYCVKGKCKANMGSEVENELLGKYNCRYAQM